MKKAEITNFEVWVTNFPSGHLEHVRDHSSVPPIVPVTDDVPDMAQHEGDVDLRARDHRVSCIIVSTKNQLIGCQDRVFRS